SGGRTTIRVIENFLPALDASPQTVSQTQPMLTETYQLAWLDRSGKQLEKLGTPAKYGWPSFSPDGKRIVVSRGEAKGADVWILQLGSGSMSRLTSGADRGYDNNFPIW